MPAAFLEVLKKHGFPTVMACALFYALFKLGMFVAVDLRNDIDHLARLVDATCVAKER